MSEPPRWMRESVGPAYYSLWGTLFCFSPDNARRLIVSHLTGVATTVDVETYVLQRERAWYADGDTPVLQPVSPWFSPASLPSEYDFNARSLPFQTRGSEQRVQLDSVLARLTSARWGFFFGPGAEVAYTQQESQPVTLRDRMLVAPTQSGTLTELRHVPMEFGWRHTLRILRLMEYTCFERPALNPPTFVGPQ